jgi:hypothetical protein
MVFFKKFDKEELCTFLNFVEIKSDRLSKMISVIFFREQYSYTHVFVEKPELYIILLLYEVP